MISQLSALINNALEQIQIADIKVSVTPLEDPSLGDYATNVAFAFAKKLKKSPLEAASLLVDELTKMKSEMLEKIDIAKPGFINFTLKNTFLCAQLVEPVLEEKSEKFNGKKIMIEFTDPNPFKEFHIGHLYSNIVGESLARLIESQGAEVRRVNYQGDVGLHVAKAIYGLMIKLKEKHIDLNDIDKKSLEEKAKFLGEAYALGARAYEEDEAAKEEIIELNKKIYAIVESTAESEKYPEIKQLYYKGRSWSLEYFETIYKRLGTKFWKYYFESEAGPVGLALVKEYLNKGIFEESQKAIIFKGEKYGLHNRVFINSLGLPTYEAKELGLAQSKYQDFPYDLSIIVTGNEINEYFRVLLKVLSLIKPELAEKTLHIGHGMVRLPEGKMSSRKGNILTGEWLLDEAVARARAKIDEVKKQIREDSYSEVAAGEQDEIAEMVGVGAVKYALLRSSIGKDIEFRFDESISFEGNSGPYLQYTYVRTRSVLEKSGLTEKKDFLKQVECPQLLSQDERQLLIDLIRWSDVKKEAAQKYSPSDICTYLFELAQHFNLFYQKYPILRASENIREFRLLLTKRIGENIKEGLWLLGIQTPEKM
jgi:arginyl-tRNA synthetase